MKRDQSAQAYAIAAVLLWATVASAFKVSLQYLDVFQLLLYASAVSLGTLFFISLFTGKLKTLTMFSKQDFLHSAVLGFFNPFLYYVLLFTAYSLLPAQQAQALNYTSPLMIVMLSIPLLKQRIGIRSLGAIVISFIGVFVASTRGTIQSFNLTNAAGTIIALSSALIWALFWVYNARDSRDEVPKLFLNFSFGFIFILIATLLFSKPGVEFTGVLGAVYVGLFEMGITFIVWLKALQSAKTTAQVSQLLYLVPFLSLISIYFVVHETILPTTIIGLSLIVGGIMLQQLIKTA